MCACICRRIGGGGGGVVGRHKKEILRGRLTVERVCGVRVCVVSVYTWNVRRVQGRQTGKEESEGKTEFPAVRVRVGARVYVSV